jgi:hypothetical protein
MPKRIPYSELVGPVGWLSTRVHVLECAYGETPDASVKHKDGRDIYCWHLYHATGCEGGHLTGTFKSSIDPHPKHRVFYVERLDTAIQQVRERSTSSFADCGMSAAVSQFQVIRQRLIDAA